jgi:hypothetical protein
MNCKTKFWQDFQPKFWLSWQVKALYVVAGKLSPKVKTICQYRQSDAVVAEHRCV